MSPLGPFRLPRAMAPLAVAILVVGFVPLTGLDHLHLHRDHGHGFVHDHLHIGHHEHGHHNHHHDSPTDTCPEKDDDEQRDHCSAVISFAGVAQVSPAPVTIQAMAPSVGERPWSEPSLVPRMGEPHPAWASRAPPA